MELKWLKELKDELKKHRKLLSITFLIIVTIFLLFPAIGNIYYWVTLTFKVDSSKINFSRLNLLQVLISILSPILTFLVLMNSVANQEATNKRLDQQSNESERRLNSEQVSNAFYRLLDVFTDIQKRVDIQKFIGKTKNLYEWNSLDFHLRNGYLSNSGYNDTLQMFLYNSDVEENKILSNSDVENMALAINLKFNELYSESSQYFKAFHRIVKILNVSLRKNKIDKEEYHSYIGILRANLSSNEMEIILMNSLFVRRGIGLGLELIGTDFFGNQNDFEINQHFVNIWRHSKKDLMNIFIDDNAGKNIELKNKLEEYFQEIKIEDIDNFNELYNHYKKISGK